MRLPKNFAHPRVFIFCKLLKLLKNHDLLGMLRGNQKFKSIDKNVLTGKYCHHPWRFVKAMDELFDEIIQRSGRRSRIQIAANQLRECFFNQMDVIMEEQGFCCGHWYKETARPVKCSGEKTCLVLPNTVYYRFETHTFCNKCFNEFQGNLFTFGDQTLDKRQFIEYFFQETKDEKFAKCFGCRRLFHEVCVLYCRVSNEVFICKNCRKERKIEQSKPVRASMIPSTACDRFITAFLHSHGINVDQLTIRMVGNEMKNLQVDELFKAFHKDISHYPYRSCSLFAFFDTGNNSDICFFSILFQVYGSDCPEPNRNTSYISYMDSVNLFPSSDRTKVYRLILLGLFDFLKTIGSTKTFLWSCPPKQGNDYIFYAKPPNMKMPNLQRLSSWYQEMLRMGLDLKIIQRFFGIYDYATTREWSGIEQIPYFEADVWITRITEAIKSVQKENLKADKEISKMFERLKKETVIPKKRLLQKTVEKLVAKQRRTDDFKRVWELVTTQLIGYENQYFVIEFPPQNATDLQPQLIEEDVVSLTWINDRHLFVDFFWSFMLEFSSERKAQYSTYIMLYRIIAEKKVCIECKQTSLEGVSGTLLCRSCYESEKQEIESNHEPNLEQNSSPLQIDASVTIKANPPMNSPDSGIEVSLKSSSSCESIIEVLSEDSEPNSVEVVMGCDDEDDKKAQFISISDGSQEMEFNSECVSDLYVNVNSQFVPLSPVDVNDCVRDDSENDNEIVCIDSSDESDSCIIVS